MDAGPLTLLMNFLGPLLIGIALAGVLFYTWRRRQSRPAQAQTNAGTRAVYEAAENERRRKEPE